MYEPPQPPSKPAKMTSATSQDLYPPSLAGIPKDLTRPDPAYGRQVVIVLVSLLLFLAFYLALIAGAGWLFWWSLSYDMRMSTASPLPEGGGGRDLRDAFPLHGEGPVQAPQAG
jgi:hypothetical protein